MYVLFTDRLDSWPTKLRPAAARCELPQAEENVPVEASLSVAW